MILQVAGVARIACASGFLPGSGSGAGSGGLPGYCPPGTYHPYPIGDPRANECAPFPTATLAAEVARQMEIQRQAQQQQQQRQQTQPQTQQQPSGSGLPQTGAGAAAGMWLNPRTGQWELIPSCPQGSVFDQRAGQCVSATSAGGSLFGSGSESNWWLWLLIAAGVLYATGGGESDSRRRR
jgi:hypothetical protein